MPVGTSERGDGKEGNQKECQELHYRSRERVFREDSWAGKESEEEGGEKKESIWGLFVCAPSGFIFQRHDRLIDPPQCLSWAVRTGTGIVSG